MIGRQELVVAIAALLLIAIILLAVLVVRRSRDHIAFFGYLLFVFGGLVFFFRPLAGLVVSGIGLIVLAIRLPSVAIPPSVSAARSALRTSGQGLSCAHTAGTIFRAQADPQKNNFGLNFLSLVKGVRSLVVETHRMRTGRRYTY
jgi:hypothetical protein